MDMRGRIALVTGRSRGIGQAIAVKLAEVGIDVALGYEKHQAQAEEVVQHISDLGCRAMAMRTDLRDPQQIATLVQSVQDVFGRIDILVNNAAIGPNVRWRRLPWRNGIRSCRSTFAPPSCSRNR